MLRNVKDLRGYAIRATDGEIGRVDDLYFDDEGWAVRYFVVDTAHWLPGRKVLISPLAIGHPDWMSRLLPASITKAQVEHSPDIDTKKPVSRQHEAAHLRYYGYPYYWGGGGGWGLGAYPGGLMPESWIDDSQAGATSATQTPDDVHLRSCTAVIGHHVLATDGEIGHVEDLLVDEQTWAIRYLIVDTSNWWGGHRVLVSPQWIRTASWSDATIAVDVTRQAVRDAPPYDAAAQLDRQQEQGMFEHYGRPGYWAQPASREAAAPPAK
ncbi:MAG TPA: PRC-barrel domain-containing protein [Vicinamibacterales bacterium]|nr:PRC-barrel domain-containing protein [Vicinamibacterales bacterium]